jgi:hypothetical protein
MPVDMAVEKPWSRVISHKTDRNIISQISHADHVTQYRVVIVICAVPCTANNIESVSMKMNRVLSRQLHISKNDTMGLTHRTASGTSWNSHLHHLTVIQSINIPRGDEVLRFVDPGQNLE